MSNPKLFHTFKIYFDLKLKTILIKNKIYRNYGEPFTWSYLKSEDLIDTLINLKDYKEFITIFFDTKLYTYDEFIKTFQKQEISNNIINSGIIIKDVTKSEKIIYEKYNDDILLEDIRPTEITKITKRNQILSFVFETLDDLFCGWLSIYNKKIQKEFI